MEKSKEFIQNVQKNLVCNVKLILIELSKVEFFWHFSKANDRNDTAISLSPLPPHFESPLFALVSNDFETDLFLSCHLLCLMTLCILY